MLEAARNGPAKSNLRGEFKMRYLSAIRSALASVFQFCVLASAMSVLFVPDALAKKPPPSPPPPPALSFSPQTSGSFDYGTVSVGGIASQDFTLTNGSGTSTTLAVKLSGSSAFAVVVDGCTGISLPNGRSCVVVVSYTSTTPSGDSATLTAAGVGKKAQAFPTSLTLNGSGEGVAHIYWSSLKDGAIRRANLDGSDIQTVINGSSPVPGIAISSSHIYWTGGQDGEYLCGSTIRAANLDGGGETTIISGQNCAQALAIDDTYLYWANNATDGTINRVNLDGSNPVTLITGTGYVTGVAVNGGHVYWGGPAGIYQANLDGSDAHFIQSGFDGAGPCSIAVDESYAYIGYCNGWGIYKVSLGGGDLFAFPGDNGDHIALYDGRVYWTPNNRIEVVDVDGSNWIPLLPDDGNGTFAVTVGPK
jgi:hypothetical protein